jgi:hypothetical protein
MTYTKGNVIVENIKVGDIHYEFEYGMFVKCEVISLPERTDDGFVWKSKNLLTGKEIEYFVNPKYAHYSSNLYDYMAYAGCIQI